MGRKRMTNELCYRRREFSITRILGIEWVGFIVLVAVTMFCMWQVSKLPGYTEDDIRECELRVRVPKLRYPASVLDCYMDERLGHWIVTGKHRHSN